MNLIYEMCFHRFLTSSLKSHLIYLVVYFSNKSTSKIYKTSLKTKESSDKNKEKFPYGILKLFTLVSAFIKFEKKIKQ